jgi:hypothetical protein
MAERLEYNLFLVCTNEADGISTLSLYGEDPTEALIERKKYCERFEVVCRGCKVVDRKTNEIKVTFEQVAREFGEKMNWRRRRIPTAQEIISWRDKSVEGGQRKMV